MNRFGALSELTALGDKWLKKLGAVTGTLTLLAFRAYFGWQLHENGWGKLHNHAKVTEFFTSLNIPMPGLNAWFVGGVECVGGLLLCIGLLSRPTALIIAGNMTVAYLSVAEDRAKLLSVFTDPEPFLSADPFFYLLTAVLVLSFGPGLISLDALVCRFTKQWRR